jgi:hypothetical protein
MRYYSCRFFKWSSKTTHNDGDIFTVVFFAHDDVRVWATSLQSIRSEEREREREIYYIHLPRFATKSKSRRGCDVEWNRNYIIGHCSIGNYKTEWVTRLKTAASRIDTDPILERIESPQLRLNASGVHINAFHNGTTDVSRVYCNSNRALVKVVPNLQLNLFQITYNWISLMAEDQRFSK